jgi:hypothetical protein
MVPNSIDPNSRKGQASSCNSYRAILILPVCFETCPMLGLTMTIRSTTCCMHVCHIKWVWKPRLRDEVCGFSLRPKC